MCSHHQFHGERERPQLWFLSKKADWSRKGMTQAIGGQVAAGRSPRSGESGSGGGDSGPVGGDSRKVQSHQLLAQVNNVASGVGVIFKGC